jgi:PAS domain S-box-containing protein
MLGYGREEYLGHNIAEFHVDEAVITDIIARLTAGRQLHDYEARLRCKDGSIRHVLLDSNAYSKDGRFIHSRCFTRDVTERRLAEAAVRETEERLRLALKAGRLGAWEWRIATGEVIWSPTLEALHGIEPGSFPGTFDAFQRDIHPEDRDRVLDAVRQTVEGAREHHLEYRIVWPDGSVHWLEARGELFRDQAGRPLRLAGVCSDITERKRIEESLWFLAEASKSLSSLIDFKSTLQLVAGLAVPRFADWCAVEMLEEDGSLQRVAVAHVDPAKVALADELNRRYPSGEAARRVLSRSESELTARITDSMIEQAARDEEHLRMLRQLQLRSYMCVPLRTKERSLGVISFAFAESGRFYGPNELAIAEDLAGRAAIAVENARLYQELREADRRKDEFLAMLAHELRNPLAPIRSGLEIMSMDQSDHHEIIQLMQEQVEHVVRLVDDLLDVSRVVRGRIELRRESVEVAAVVRRSVKAVQRLVEGRNQELAVSMPQEPIWLTADPVRIVQVLENLLNNASKYSDAGTRIDLSVERQGGEAVIQVHDTGMGIEPELLPHIFDLFTQSPRSLDRSQGGLGIGLTLTQRLVEMHDGTISASSEGPGKGSTFTVRLPVTEKAARPARNAKETHAAPGRRILIVDDNVGAAHMLSLLLAELDHEVVETANDGPTALERIEAMRPEVILLDIGLPGMDGYDVAREIRSKPDYDEVLLVCLTGYGQYEDRLKSKEAGFDLHLVKPPSLAQIKEVLSHPKLTRAGT